MSTAGSEDAHIHIQVNGQDGSAFYIKIRRSSQLHKLMNAYCSHQSLEMSSVAFLHAKDGRRLLPWQTPLELDMENGDRIVVVMHQRGGNITQTVG